MSCWLSCSIFIIVALLLFGLIAAFVFWFTLNQVKKNFRRNYVLSTIDYCRDLENEQIHYTSSIERPRRAGIYEYRLARALLEVSLAVSQSNCINKVPIDNPPGFNGQYRIIAPHPRDNKRRMFATVFTDGTEPAISRKLAMVFTGTFFMDEWATDINFPLKEAVGINNYQAGIKIHRGFYNLYMSFRDQLWQLYNRFAPTVREFYITGHSLGGALATIAAFDFARHQPIYYSFASPRVGNPNFANSFDKLNPTALRIYNIEDVITEVPFPITLGNVYQHVSSGIAFNVNLGSIRENHINAYIRYLPRCIPNIAPCD